MRRISLLCSLVLLCSTSPAWAWGGVPDWVKAVAKTPIPSLPDSPRGVVLLDSRDTTVTDAGSITTRHRRVVKILTTEGRELAYQAVYFDNDTQITSFHAWAITASGEEYTLKEHDAVQASAFDGALYADDRIEVVKIPAAEPGNIVAFEFEQRERPLMLQDIWTFQGSDPVLRAQFSLTLPAGWKHEERWYNAPAAPAQTAGAMTSWEVVNIPALHDEPSMPSYRALAGRMAINFVGASGLGTRKSWDDVARWYAGLTGPQRTSTPAVKEKTVQLIAGKTGVLDRIRPLASFAQRDVRYVAIEIGIGGYKPHAASEVFLNRFGDCKDKATLLATMLKEAGIEAYLVLVNTSRDYVDQDFPTMGAFNHVITAIRLPADVPIKGLYSVVEHPRLGRLLLFDPTSTTTPIGYLPSYLQDSHGLLVTENGGELLTLPTHPPAANRLSIVAKMKLDANGTLAGDVTELRSGWLADGWRYNLQTKSEGERKRYMESRLAGSLTQQTLEDLSFENVDDLSRDLVVHYRLTAHAYARHAAGMLLVRPRVIGYSTNPVDLKDRRYALETDGPYVETNDVAIELPPGVKADELPPEQNLKTSSVTYKSESKADGSTLSYRRDLTMDKFRIPLAGLPDLNKVLAAISADERNSAILK